MCLSSSSPMAAGVQPAHPRRILNIVPWYALCMFSQGAMFFAHKRHLIGAGDGCGGRTCRFAGSRPKTYAVCSAITDQM